MQETYYEKSRSLAAEFKKSLRSGTGEKLSSSDEENLVKMIASAIAGEVNVAIEKIEAVANELRSNIDKPDISL